MTGDARAPKQVMGTLKKQVYLPCCCQKVPQSQRLWGKLEELKTRALHISVCDLVGGESSEVIAHREEAGGAAGMSGLPWRVVAVAQERHTGVQEPLQG